MSDWKSRATPVSTGDWKSRAISEQEQEFSVYTTPAASKIAEAGKWALGRVGEASQFIDKYTMGPVRAAIGAVQEGRSLTEPYDYEKTPTWKDIAEKAGLSGEPTIQSPVVLNPFDPEANKLSPAGIAGAALGTLTDPLTYLGTPGVGAGVKLGAEGAEIMARQGAKKMGEIAESRMAKQALGGYQDKFFDAAQITRKGTLDPALAKERIRNLGREILDTKGLGRFPSTEKISEVISEKLDKVGDVFGEISSVVDNAIPEGAISGPELAKSVRALSDELADLPQFDAIKARIEDTALRLESKPGITFSEAQKMKNSLQYKHGSPDPLDNDKNFQTKIKFIIGDAMNEATKKVAPRIIEDAQKYGVNIDDIIPQLQGIPKIYETAKTLYGPYVKVTKASGVADIKSMANRLPSLTDYMTGLGVGSAGASLTGDAITTALLTAGGTIGNKIARDYGPAAAARAADSLKNMLQSGGEALSKYKPVLEKAAMAGNQSLILTHQTLMNNDPTYRQAVIQGLTSVQTEPFKSIGNAMDTAGMAGLAAGVVIPFSLRKNGDILKGVFDMIKQNVGEDPAEVKRAFLAAVKERYPDKNIKVLEDFFDNSYWAANAGKNKNYDKFYEDYQRIKSGTPNEDDLLLSDWKKQFPGKTSKKQVQDDSVSNKSLRDQKIEDALRKQISPIPDKKDAATTMRINAEKMMRNQNKLENVAKTKRLPKADEVFNQFLLEFDESDTFTNAFSQGNKKAQREGMFGMTQAEMIDAWRDFVDNELKASDELKEMIKKEIEDTYEWHRKNGSLDDEI